MKIKDQFIEAIIYSKSIGYSLINEDWGSEEEKCADALGCLLIFNKKKFSNKSDELVKEILSVSSLWVDAFISGYDNTPWNLKISLNNEAYLKLSDLEILNLEEAFVIGVSIREQFKPITYDLFSQMWKQCSQ